MFYIHHILLQNSWRDVYFEKVVVGGHPLSIVTHDHSDEPVVFRCGDDSWTKIPYLEGKADICNFKGWPCLIDKTGLTVIIKPDLSVHLLAEPLLDGGDVKVFVENECELLMVDRYVRNGDDGDVRIDVFRLDEKRRKWVKVENLGDRVLILGEGCSFSASASDLGFANGNFVIYSNGAKVWGHEMSVFHLDQSQVSPLSDYPDYAKLFWPPPEWIVKQCLS